MVFDLPCAGHLLEQFIDEPWDGDFSSQDTGEVFGRQGAGHEAPGQTLSRLFKHRLFYTHTAHVTLMRTTPEANAQIGASMARKLSAATGPVAILLPGRGGSAIAQEGQPVNDPAARKALHDAIRSGVRDIHVTELDLHINDPEFADAAANKLLELMKITALQR